MHGAQFFHERDHALPETTDAYRRSRGSSAEFVLRRLRGVSRHKRLRATERKKVGRSDSKQGNEANHEIRLMSVGDAENMVRFSEMLLRFIYEMPNMLGET